MTDLSPVTFYLEDGLRQSAQDGQHNFINLMCDVLIENGMNVAFAPVQDRNRGALGHSLTHMAQPPNDAGLVFRRVYHYPFWQIDAVAQQWQWDVARARFDPDAASADAPRFYRFWQKRLFGEAAVTTRRDGFVYVPLQGKLDQQRSFQSCSPLEMIEHCLDHDPKRQFIAALHPKEIYQTSERAKLRALAQKHARLTIDTGNMETHLKGCDYIVTQNSGVAFSGCFFGKPTLLFGQIDFHHIAVQADMQNLEASFAKVHAWSPAYDKFIWWFWQDQSINAGREDAKSKIAARLKRFGWPIA
jgi:hypothetical protein